MFSDTHFHFHMMINERGIDGKEVLQNLASRSFMFGLDIGTACDDLEPRLECVKNEILKIEDKETQKKALDFMYFTAGIWPNIEDIHNREACVKKLEKSINVAQENKKYSDLHNKIIAIGECGLDHHWNPSGADGRCESDFDKQTYDGEKELFMMQLELAKKMSLPVIVHSRDAFEDSFECINNIGYHNGIIHCFSYGIEEARSFLDKGWYIAFGGGTTYTKKAKMQQMSDLLKFIPEDRLLLETDAPYLAPVPYRGQTNTPVLIEHVYNFIAQIRETTASKLSETVDKNIKHLFFN